METTTIICNNCGSTCISDEIFINGEIMDACSDCGCYLFEIIEEK